MFFPGALQPLPFADIICFFAETGVWPSYPPSMQATVNEMSQLILTQKDEQIREFCRGKFSPSANESVKTGMYGCRCRVRRVRLSATRVHLVASHFAAIIRKFLHPFRLPTTTTTNQPATTTTPMPTDAPTSAPINQPPPGETTEKPPPEPVTLPPPVDTEPPPPVDPIPDEPQPDEPMPDEPTPDEPQPDEPQPDEPTPDEPMPADPIVVPLPDDPLPPPDDPLPPPPDDPLPPPPVEVTNAMQTDAAKDMFSKVTFDGTGTRTTNRIDDKLDMADGTVEKQNILLGQPFSYNTQNNAI